MFKKVVHISIILVIVFLCFVFLVKNIDAAENHIIKAVYFVPNDRPIQQHLPPKFSNQIKEVQEFYADQMEFHGYGRMTFEYEKDGNNNPIVHQVIGNFSDAYYRNNTSDKVEQEIRQKFHDVDNNIYIISIDVSYGLINGYCGIAKYEGGPAFIPSTGDCVKDDDVINLISHELGHALNLHHDFRNVKNIMARGGSHRNQFSECSAMLLSVSHFLNRVHTHVDTKGQIEMLTPETYIIDHREHQLKFKVSDPDRISMVFLEYMIPTHDLARVGSCKSVLNKITIDVSFDMFDDAIKSPTTRIWLHVFDVNGHGNTREYALTGVEKNDLGFTYITLEHESPNSLKPTNPKMDWGWDWGGWKHYWEKKPDENVPERPHQGFANVWNIPFIGQWKHWFYAHVEGEFVYDLTLTEKDHRVFDAYLHLPNPCGNIASIDMICKADGVEIYRTGIVRFWQAQNKHIVFEIPENTQEFIIEMDDAGDEGVCDHYIIANAKLLRFEPEEESEGNDDTEDSMKDSPKDIKVKSKLVLTWAKIKNE